MKRPFHSLLPLVLSGAAFASGPGNPGEPGVEQGLALKAAKVLTVPVDGPQVVDNGVVLVHDGRIEAVGPAATTAIPKGWETIDLGERWLAPGMIDLHNHVAGGLRDLNDMVYLTNPGLRASTTITPRNSNVQRALGGGVTSVLLIPGSGTNVGGQGVLVKLGHHSYEEVEIRNPGSLKLAQAGNPERFLFGVGRSFMNWNTRNTFRRGVAYAKRWEAHEREGGEGPAVDPQFEVFRPLYTKQTQVSTHTQMYQVVMMTVLMIKQELGIDVYIDHGTFDGWRAAPLAEAAAVPAILGPRNISVPSRRMIDWTGSNPERIQGVAAGYQDMGHTMIGFNTDAPVLPSEELFFQASMGVRYGFRWDELQSVRGVTIVPALAAGIADRVGSLEAGKDADILIIGGDPVDPRSMVEAVLVDGVRVYDAGRDGQRF
ncbi:MAG: amidohydrolase family protein [Planctomycetota bacterium]|jgi:imidazolonepropionase-like amidohydrolase|nr:amidohydrolase family protein [Planctomycetota bacterium]MDP6763073.1 amidohydrolase family protein [Planctomycetota bacterium]MDP6989030.1 amidohydrolase family protein [Planctomycetota bacterium]